MTDGSEVDAIAAICREVGVDAGAEQLSALARYLELLRQWNATYNLTAVRDPASMRTQHLADCIAVIPPLRRESVAGRILDVGSGGGLPGVVIAIFVPELQVTCVDAVGKKAAFVRQVAGALALPNLAAVHARVEDGRVGSGFNAVISRAFAALPDFVRWTDSRLAPEGWWVAMKGRQPENEMAALPAGIEMFHVEHLRVPGLDAERCLVWMRRRRPKEPREN